jgi:integrase/recombinase XerD
VTKKLNQSLVLCPNHVLKGKTVYETTTTTALQVYTLPDIKDLLAGRLAPNTITRYREDVSQYQAFAVGQGLRQGDAQTLAAWRDDLVLNSTKSPHTINRQLAAVRKTIKEAATRQMVPPDVAFAFGNVESVSVRALRDRLKKNGKVRIFPQEMRALCDTPDTSTLIGLRDRALLHTLASSGLRISEALDLQPEMIEQRGQFFILKVIGKSDIEPREAHISHEAKGYIDRWLAERPVDSVHIFTSFEGRGTSDHSRLESEPLTRHGAWRIIRSYGRKVGLLYLHPHSFRAFVATELAGRDILKASRALGHKNINTTSKYYVLSGISAGETDNLF